MAEASQFCWQNKIYINLKSGSQMIKLENWPILNLQKKKETKKTKLEWLKVYLGKVWKGNGQKAGQCKANRGSVTSISRFHLNEVRIHLCVLSRNITNLSSIRKATW